MSAQPVGELLDMLVYSFDPTVPIYDIQFEKKIVNMVNYSFNNIVYTCTNLHCVSRMGSFVTEAAVSRLCPSAKDVEKR